MTEALVVTTASRGIGRRRATQLTQDGCTLVILDRNLPARAGFVTTRVLCVCCGVSVGLAG